MDCVKIFLSFLSIMKDDVKIGVCDGDDDDGITLFTLGEMKINSVLVQAVVVFMNETHIIIDDGTNNLIVTKELGFKFKVGQYLQLQLSFSKLTDGSLSPDIKKIYDLSNDKPNRESLWTYEVMHIHVTCYFKFIDKTGKLLSKLKSEMKSNKINNGSNTSPTSTLSTSPTVHLKEDEEEEKEEKEPQQQYQQHEQINLDDTDDQDFNTIIEEESMYSRKNEQDFDYYGYYEGDTSNMDDYIFDNGDDIVIDYKDNSNHNNEKGDGGDVNGGDGSEDDEIFSEFSAPPQVANKKLKLSKRSEDNELNNSNNSNASNNNNNINENSMDDNFSFSNNDTSNMDQDETAMGSDDSWGEEP